MKLSRIIKRFRIDHPQKFRLVDIDPGDICGLDIDKAEAKAIIAKSIQQLACRQDVLYATIAGRFSRSFRPWMRPGRTRRSSTSCRASIRKHARFSRSRRRAMRNWTTTFCGAPMSACPSAAASESSIAPITRKCWWCGCIGSCWSVRNFPTSRRQEHLAVAFPIDQRARAASRAQQDQDREIPFAHFQGRAAQALFGSVG